VLDERTDTQSLMTVEKVHKTKSSEKSIQAKFTYTYGY